MKKDNRFITSFTFFVILYFAFVFFNNELFISLIKPIPILILISNVLKNSSSSYSKLILVGLIFSLIGDILLVSQIDIFLLGLGSFLLGHIFYIIAFFVKDHRFEIMKLIPFCLYGIILFTFLRGGLGSFYYPVMAYSIVIITMVWRAFELKGEATNSRYVFYGALLFCISDSLLAISMFKWTFPFEDYLIMSTYWLGQLLIAGSVS